jgi:hypothetical protein
MPTAMLNRGDNQMASGLTAGSDDRWQWAALSNTTAAGREVMADYRRAGEADRRSGAGGMNTTLIGVDFIVDIVHDDFRTSDAVAAKMRRFGW